MNIFVKSKLVSILDNKVKSGEIKFYQITSKTIHIRKSKRTKVTLDIQDIKGDILVGLMVKKIPDPSVINISDFYKRELRNLKLNSLLK